MARRSTSFVLAVAAVFAAAVLVTGCVTEGPPPRDPPTPVPSQPDGIRATRMLPTVAQFAIDTNGNGLGDLIQPTIFLFNDQYAFPLALRGAFTFRLMTHHGRLLTTWEFDSAKAQAAVRMLNPGPGYVFELDMLKAGGEYPELASCDLFVTFAPQDGPAIQSRGPTTVTLRVR
ncbi:MAG: hypothetical protein JNM07_06965 [Phycisphaerae bacterium]|nr:hypothetical protein [Phycisphaerae bacterium]